jgi:2-hydroxy-3-oxopropionate reductase
MTLDREEDAMASIGFIGLGIMGKPMSKHLIKAGHSLLVYDIYKPSVVDVVAAGAAEGASVADVAQRTDIVITMLPDSPDVQKVLGGPDGVIANAKNGALIIDMSTISPVVSRQLEQEAVARGLKILDAPVSGGEKGAIEATLSIMVGGEADVFQQALPFFQIMGRTIVHVGSYGAGQVVKACNQVMVAMQMQAMAEALVLGTKAGVDPAKIIEVLTAGYAQCRVMQVRGPEILKRNFKPGFKVKLHYKDLNIALATGAEYGVPLPGTALVHEMFGAMKAAGKGEDDHSGVITVLEQLAGIEVKSDH